MAIPIVLVVEDDPAIRRLIVSWLGKWGYQPIEAISPETAALTEPKPALAIIDLRLQGRYRAGVQLCEWIKNEWQIPIIVTTAYDSDEIRQEIEPFCDTLCIKPMVLKCIRQALDRLLPVDLATG